MRLTRFRNLFFVVVSVFSHLIIAYDSLEGFTQIECELRLKMRSSRKRNYDDFTVTEQTNSSAYASFTHPHFSVKESNSLNWSGYAALTNLTNPTPNSVTAVYGSWIVPKLSPSRRDTYCAVWVGMDGYSNNTVEEIGTEHDWHNGCQHNYAWFEMYPNASYEIVGFPVNPGDVINASVVYTCNGVFVLTLVNETRKVYFVAPTSETTSIEAQRSSAEWIVEAPYDNGILPLSHFNKIYFKNCTAMINNIHGPINEQFWQNDALTMVTTCGQVKAEPSRLTSHGQGFSVEWKHE
jgi:hypothetical protein